MTHEYGKHIRATLRPYRTMREAGLHHDLRAARWAESDRRIDLYIFWGVVAAFPLAAIQLYWRF